MQLTITDFLTWYNTTYSTPYIANTTGVSIILEMYKEEISSVIPVLQSNSNITKRYSFSGCGEFFLHCPVWLDYTVKIGDKKNLQNLTTITENTDYIALKSKVEETKMIGLDFSCLRCNCKCEIVEITGKFGYILPDILIKVIFNLILGFYPNTTQPVDNCESESFKTLTQIKTGSITKTYTTNQKQTELTQNLKKGFDIINYEPVKRILAKYKPEIIKI